MLEKYDIQPSPPDLPAYVSSNDPSEIEGIYVKKAGYDKVVDNGNGSLTWIRNAQNPNPESYVLTFQDNVYRAQDRSESIIFKNIEWDGQDQFVMIQSGSSGSELDEYVYGGYVRTIVGQKVPAPALSDAWKNRVGIYVSDNIPWDDIRLVLPFWQLEESDGVLSMLPLGQGAEGAAIKESDAVAFLEGLANRSDSSIRVVRENGKEKLLYGGYRSYAINQVPPIASGDVVSGTVSIFKSDWYRYDAAAAGQTMNITITTDPSHYALTLFDQNLAFVAREMGALSWTAEQDKYLVEISPTPDASGNYTMSVN